MSCNKRQEIKLLPYPATPRGDVVDDYFGTRVEDPYRWLEDDASEQTAAWVKAQNAVTFDYLDQIPFRNAIKERLTSLSRYSREGVPVRHGDYFYFTRNDGLRNQAVLYRQKELDGQTEVVIDPNALSENGTVAISNLAFSKDGRYLAYSVAASGSDWMEIRVMDLSTMQQLADRIEWVKFSGASWAPDSKGFYYSRYDQPEQGVYSAQNQYEKVFYHPLGGRAADDRLVYMDAAHPLRSFSARPSEEGQWLFVYGMEGTSGTELLYRPAVGRGNFEVLLPGFDNDYEVVTVQGGYAYLHTNDGAPNFRLARIDLRNPKGLEDVIPEDDSMRLERVTTAGSYLMATYLRDATHRVVQYDMQGRAVRELDLEQIGTVEGFEASGDDTTVCYSLTTFTSPASVYRYDLSTGASTLVRAPELAFDPGRFTTEQLFFESKDGERVPIFVVHRKDLKLDGRNPLYLYGYGGFNISLTPWFKASTIMLLEQGGVYAMVNLRGGGEYGERWHRAGMLANKQNVFDDFIAAAEYLIERGYTSSEKLAIAGGSNGGLLVGACQVQRPDLFAVCLPAVGVLDMLRYHRFTIGSGWVVEYGSSEDEEQFGYIYKYSPLHNIREGTAYPATLITTGDHDDRVVPAHSFKFAATLQHAQRGSAPILIRVETDAGHGAGKPVSKYIEEETDAYSFFFWNTNTEFESVP